MADASAVYLYCLVRADSPLRTVVPASLPDASPVEAHEVGSSLWLIAARVPLAVYGSDALEARLRDLDWVSRVAVAHASVIEHFARRRGTTVVPFTLLTMFSSLAKALADVRRRRSALERTLSHIRGADEWGVRVLRRPVPAARAAGRPSSGTAFLAARKRARDAVADARTAAADAAERAFRALSRHARDVDVRERNADPGTTPPILDAAFLVPAESRARFRAEARRQARLLDAAGAAFTLTGPWPAYHFVRAGERG